MLSVLARLLCHGFPRELPSLGVVGRDDEVEGWRAICVAVGVLESVEGDTFRVLRRGSDRVVLLVVLAVLLLHRRSRDSMGRSR